ncbi:hypothetical protein WBG78_28825 [Chryseolinea sp. T2]|uniref:hypothetical protein n=1 Tax=Chryseolinea sp. T2 TaxID=3129255 RepID=UPI0030773BAF
MSLKVVTPQVQALSMIGSYFGYVCADLSKPTLLRLPAQIYESAGKVWIELQDVGVTFRGELTLQGGVMFVQMTSEDRTMLFSCLQDRKATWRRGITGCLFSRVACVSTYRRKSDIGETG